MTFFKIILNSIISTKGAKCMMIDLRDFYFNTPMKQPEYMHLKMTDIYEEIFKQYKLRELQPKTDMYTQRSQKECMAYHKPG
jgi:hypothetical protein